jgi:hypothetical protein
MHDQFAELEKQVFSIGRVLEKNFSLQTAAPHELQCARRRRQTLDCPIIQI